MSYDYRYQRTTTNQGSGGRRRGPAYIPPSRGNSGHSVLGYWVPLVVTGTIAIGGLAAWIWSERSDSEDDDYPSDKPPRPQTGMGASYPTPGSQPYPRPPPPPGQQGGMYGGPSPSAATGPPPGGPSQMAGGEASSYYNETQSRDVQQQQQQQQEMDSTWYGRMTGAIKRTPSPQQFLDSASKQVSAGMAAAGAALGSIMEGSDEESYDDARGTGGRRGSKRREERTTEEREGFSDHERWSEEADERQRVGPMEAESERRAEAARNAREAKGRGRAKKAVAVVVSADTNADIEHEYGDEEYRTEHASILSHLPAPHTASSTTTDLFVLIYAPGLKSLPPTTYKPTTTENVTPTAGSTYSTTSTPAATPGSELQSISPRVSAAAADSNPPSATFDALYQQALALVDSPTQILPFTTPDGYVHILRHLAPQLVYISDALGGDDGEGIAQLKGWVGHTVLVAGEGGHGGLVDTETETEGEDERGGGEEGRRERWYERSGFVGLGKEVEVVDAGRVGEDWGRRVGGRV